METAKPTTKAIKALDNIKKLQMNKSGKFKNISGKSTTLSIGGCKGIWEKQISAKTFTFKDTQTGAVFVPDQMVDGVILNSLENFYKVLKDHPTYISEHAYVYNFIYMLAGPGTDIFNWIYTSNPKNDVNAASIDYLGKTAEGEYNTIGLVEYMDALNGGNINVPKYLDDATSPAGYVYSYINLNQYISLVKEFSKNENSDKKKQKEESSMKRTGGIQKFIITHAKEINETPISTVDIVSPALIKELVKSIGEKTEASKEKRKGRNVDIMQRIEDVKQTKDKILNISGIQTNGTGIKKVARPSSLTSGTTDKRRTSDLVPITAVSTPDGLYYVYYKGSQTPEESTNAIKIFGDLTGYDVSADIQRVNRPAVAVQVPRI